MRDTWRCRRYLGGLPVGVTRDTWRNRSVPREAHAGHVSHSEASGEYHSRNSRRTRRLPGGFYRLGYSGHVALSEGKSEGGSEGGAFGVAFGTRGVLRKGCEGGLSVGHVPKGFRTGLSAGLRE